MQSIQKYLRMAGFFLINFFLLNSITAQTLDSAKVLYNEGVTAVQAGDNETGIKKLEESLNISKTIYKEEEDPDAESMMIAIKDKLPELYYQLSLKKLKEKDMNAGFKYALEAEKKSKEFGDKETLGKVTNLLSNIYYSNALSKYKESKHDEALAELDKAIEESGNLKAHNLKLVILKDQDKDDQLIDAAKTAIEAAEAQNDRESRQKFVQLAGTHFYNKGVLAKQSSDYDKALKNVQVSLDFNNENPDAYYLLTTVYNTKNEWDKAIATANEGLKYESESGKAKFYYEIGNAQHGKGDDTAACSSFAKAATGEYAQTAKYQMEHVVKCQ